MNETVTISIPVLLLFSVILIFPVLIFRHLRLRLTKDLIISMLRMGVQLGLVAIYLEYIFKLDMLLVNVAWVLVMIVVATGSAFLAVHFSRSVAFDTCGRLDASIFLKRA